MSAIKIRNFKKGDEPQIAKICLLTGYSGKDASEYFKYKNLLAEYYALPYLHYEPELCFVAAQEDVPVGYILGVSDSEEFGKWCEQNWFPQIREKYSLTGNYKSAFEKRIVQLLYEGYAPKKELSEYPAHLHIDLLPIAQGKGMGRKLMELFLETLTEQSVEAVHLEVGKRNTGAIKFYRKLNFTVIHEYENSIAFGKRLRK